MSEEALKSQEVLGTAHRYGADVLPFHAGVGNGCGCSGASVHYIVNWSEP